MPSDGFVATSSLTRPVEACRPTSLLGYAASAGAVVATDPASADVDRGNEITLR